MIFGIIFVCLLIVLKELLLNICEYFENLELEYDFKLVFDFSIFFLYFSLWCISRVILVEVKKFKINVNLIGFLGVLVKILVLLNV